VAVSNLIGSLVVREKKIADEMDTISLGFQSNRFSCSKRVPNLRRHITNFEVSNLIGSLVVRELSSSISFSSDLMVSNLIGSLVVREKIIKTPG